MEAYGIFAILPSFTHIQVASIKVGVAGGTVDMPAKQKVSQAAT